MIDHIDGNRLNNKIENLRDTNQVINCHNRKKANKDNSTSGVLGVHKCKDKYRAQITINKKVVSIGLYQTKEEAYNAYLSYKP